MAIPELLKADCDAVVDKLAAFGDLQATQAKFVAANGRYSQGVLTHATVPGDRALLAPSKSRKPTDQDEDWTAGLGENLAATLPCALAVDVYHGPDGQGYGIRALVMSAGKLYARVEWIVNPAGVADQDWAEVEAAS